jgi:hypothetical protein
MECKINSGFHSIFAGRAIVGYSIQYQIGALAFRAFDSDLGCADQSLVLRHRVSGTQRNLTFVTFRGGLRPAEPCNLLLQTFLADAAQRDPFNVLLALDTLINFLALASARAFCAFHIFLVCVGRVAG